MVGGVSRANVLLSILWGVKGRDSLSHIANAGRRGGGRAPGHTICGISGAGVGNVSSRVAQIYSREDTTGLVCNNMDVEPDSPDNVPHSCSLAIPPHNFPNGIKLARPACPPTQIFSLMPTSSCSRPRCSVYPRLLPTCGYS